MIQTETRHTSYVDFFLMCHLWYKCRKIW